MNSLPADMLTWRRSGHRANLSSSQYSNLNAMRDSPIPPDVFERFQSLQRYVGWTEDDAARVREAAPLVQEVFEALANDFYTAIEQHARAARVITGGAEQTARLKGTLAQWLGELFDSRHDRDYVTRRWRVGWRHVEVGLEQAFTNVAMSRLRDGLLRGLEERWEGDSKELSETTRSINRLIDLDLAIIQDAYETEHVRRQRQAERRRGEAAFRQLVEAAGSMIVILRKDHTVAYFNPFAEALTGYAAAAVVGRDYFPLFIPEGEQEGVATQIKQIFSGIPTRKYENAVLCRDGTQRWVLWNAQRLDDFEGQPAILAIGQDITERTTAEQRALRAERLAAIGQTVAGLAHESRNAFQRSQACLELLELELEGQDEKLELVFRIQRALDHLHRLYEEVRDYAAPIVLDRQVCDLARLWREAWSQAEVSRREKHIEIVENLGETDLGCSVDWFAAGQVFRNIFENAIDASPDRGVVTVSCGMIKLDNNPAIEISIQDNGLGIVSEVRGEVFDAFFTTKPKGTGLGMAIARRIIEAHGGQLDLGVADGGAQFIIRLPRD
ncbi:MAG TPA: protoglobin domain-containing protein [Pirellulaceae bacterium]|nr:protoglobin domain-containing protein [Pirellulaceae bacterium]